MPVVAGVDGSETALAVLERASAEAQWRGQDLRVVHVVATPVVYADVVTDLTALVEAQRRAVWGQLESAMGSIEVATKRVDLDGYPSDMLVEYASKVDSELVVIGNRGRGGVASLLLGSTSHRVIHEAPCDVLVVKAG